MSELAAMRAPLQIALIHTRARAHTDQGWPVLTAHLNLQLHLFLSKALVVVVEECLADEVKPLQGVVLRVLAITVWQSTRHTHKPHTQPS